MMAGDREVFFGTAIPPGPSPELRDRVLSAARAAAPEGGHDVSVIDRLWAHRRLRRAWAVVVSALLLGHVALSLALGPAAGRTISATSPGTPAHAGAESGSPGNEPSRPGGTRPAPLRIIDAALDPSALQLLR